MADAFLNLGTGPYPNQSLITTGNAQPWYDSPQVASLFGGQPDAQQQASFANTVLQHVEQTFHLANIPINLTTDPNVPTFHTLSVVSGTSSRSMPDAIGMTEIGGSGFSFIDPIAHLAQSVDQLAWIVAHNVSHELMLAFGVPENYDQSGNFIDATKANWSMLTSPDATFSPGAAQALLTQSSLGHVDATDAQGAQFVDPLAVPEPATLLVWAIGAAISVGCLRRRRAEVR
jgi:hypothetical protein